LKKNKKFTLFLRGKWGFAGYFGLFSNRFSAHRAVCKKNLETARKCFA